MANYPLLIDYCIDGIPIDDTEQTLFIQCEQDLFEGLKPLDDIENDDFIKRLGNCELLTMVSIKQLIARCGLNDLVCLINNHGFIRRIATESFVIDIKVEDIIDGVEC